MILKKSNIFISNIKRDRPVSVQQSREGLGTQIHRFPLPRKRGSQGPDQGRLKAGDLPKQSSESGFNCFSHYAERTYYDAVKNGYSKIMSRMAATCIKKRLKIDYEKAGCRCLTFDDTTPCEKTAARRQGINQKEYRLAISYHCTIKTRERLGIE